MKPSILILAAGFASVICAAASEQGAVKPYELKSRSSFRMSPDARVPFWPIGWVRPGAQQATTVEAPAAPAAKVELDPGQFYVTSVLLGHPALATINGHSFAEGELLPVVLENERLKVVVRSIRDGGVTLDHDGRQFFVPLRRPELAPKAAAQPGVQTGFVIKVGPAPQKETPEP